MVGLVGLVCAVCSVASAAVPGIPEPPTPGAIGEGWGGRAHDDMGIGARTTGCQDDHRTNELMLAGRPFAAVPVAIDHSILTDRAGGTRVDELTATIGWLPFGDGADDRPWAAFGGGVRYSGDVRGQGAQNDVHDAFNVGCLYLAYDEPAASAVGYALARLPWYPLRWAGFEAVLAGLASTAGELQGSPGVRGVLRGWDCQLWGGVRCELRNGVANTPTGESVHAHERGAWLDYGVAWRWLSLTGGWAPGTHDSFGLLAITVHP